MEIHQPWEWGESRARMKFDFDGTQMVQAAEPENEAMEDFKSWLTQTAIAWNVVLWGWNLAAWIYHGGYIYLVKLFVKFAPAIYIMAVSGM